MKSELAVLKCKFKLEATCLHNGQSRFSTTNCRRADTGGKERKDVWRPKRKDYEDQKGKTLEDQKGKTFEDQKEVGKKKLTAEAIRDF